MLKLWIEENKIEKQDYPSKMKFYEFQEKIEITNEIKKDIGKRVLLGLDKPGYLKFKFNNLGSVHYLPKFGNPQNTYETVLKILKS